MIIGGGFPPPKFWATDGRGEASRGVGAKAYLPSRISPRVRLGDDRDVEGAMGRFFGICVLPSI